MSLLRRILPLSPRAVAWWAWRNRRELRGWVAFGRRAAPQVGTARRPDLLAEARLRAALTRDRRTRGANLSVRVVDGEAFLGGTVHPEAHRAAFDMAGRSKGIRGVTCDIQDAESRGRSRRPRPRQGGHVHGAPPGWAPAASTP